MLDVIGYLRVPWNYIPFIPDAPSWVSQQSIGVEGKKSLGIFFCPNPPKQIIWSSKVWHSIDDPVKETNQPLPSQNPTQFHSLSSRLC
jgi:hypothetical protein